MIKDNWKNSNKNNKYNYDEHVQEVAERVKSLRECGMKAQAESFRKKLIYYVRTRQDMTWSDAVKFVEERINKLSEKENEQHV